MNKKVVSISGVTAPPLWQISGYGPPVLSPLNVDAHVSCNIWRNNITSHIVSVKRQQTTRCSAIAKRPRCRVRYSFRQK